MYTRIDGNIRMTDIDASEQYPSNYIIIRMDSIESPMGTILGIGDTREETYAALREMEDTAYCGVIEGLNFQHSLGGVVVVSG